MVVAFGGDGTVNEAANGLGGLAHAADRAAGRVDERLGRTLGIPNDVVDATEHLLRMADEFEPFRVDLGRVDERHFVFAAGAGLDASVVERVDATPTGRRASAPGTTAPARSRSSPAATS